MGRPAKKMLSNITQTFHMFHVFSCATQYSSSAVYGFSRPCGETHSAVLKYLNVGIMVVIIYQSEISPKNLWWWQCTSQPDMRPHRNESSISLSLSLAWFAIKMTIPVFQMLIVDSTNQLVVYRKLGLSKITMTHLCLLIDSTELNNENISEDRL